MGRSTRRKPLADPAPLALATIEDRAREPLRHAARLATAAALLWVPQAAVLAFGLAALQEGESRPALAGAALFAALAALQAARDHRAGAAAFASANAVVGQLRAEVAACLARRAPRDGAAAPAGAMAALGADKLDVLRPHLVRYGSAWAKMAVVPAALLLTTASVNWAAALVLLVAGPLIPLFMALVGIAARETSERQMAALGTLTGLLLDRLRALADIRLLAASAAVADRFADDAETLHARTMAVLRIAFLSSAMLELFSALGVAMVAVHVGFTLLGILDFGTWGGPVTLWSGLFVLMLAPEFFRPMRDLAAVWHDRAAALAVAGEIAAVLDDAGPRILGSGAAVPPLPGAALVALEAVAVPGRPVVSATIPPGAAVAVTGPSGAGKSVLLAILTGLDRPLAGSVRVAGVALDDASADAWRARLAWVGQRPHFVAGLVAGQRRACEVGARHRGRARGAGAGGGHGDRRPGTEGP